MAGPEVRFDEIEITCQQSNGDVETVSWAELRAVFIETTSAGPFDTDLYWLLVGKDRGCAVPSGAKGEKQLFERLQKLPNFDNDQVIAAMSCVEEKRFLCWKREDAGY